MAELDATLDGIEAVFLDLDGTIYLGETLVAGALDFLGRIESRGIHRFFLSNNSSRSVSQYLSKLRGLGIAAEADEVLLSTHDLLSWLSSEGVTETYLVGTEGMRGMLEDSGVTTNSDAPQYVVLGYDTEITYEKLAKATIHLHNGVLMVASHPDTVCPSPDGGLPDSGEQCAMIGDRLYTDMEMAERAGVHGILVLSGEAAAGDLEQAPQSPSLVVSSVDELAH